MMLKKRWIKGGVVFFAFLFFFFSIFEMNAFARVGGGRTSGSRGSRTYSAPRSSSPSRSTQPSPAPETPQPSPQPQPQPQTPPQSSSPQSSLWRGLGGGLLGGLIGGMLFRGLGFGGNQGGFAGGIGLFEILLMGGLLFGLYWFFKRRRQVATTQAYGQDSAEPMAPYQTSYGYGYDQAREDNGGVEKGLSYIRQMDSSFDEKRFQDLCMDYFFKIQGAWGNRDLSAVKGLLSEELFGTIQADAEKLRAEKKINRLENIAVRSVDLVEVWQESGSDFITVRFYANLLDFVEDEKTGQVLSGSKTEPVKFEEYWTYTRPVGDHPWRLSAIQQVE